MSIKAYKGLVVPFPCKKEWKWMLTGDGSGCLNVHPEGGENCNHVDCYDCVYFNREARAEYYKSCFPEIPKLTVGVFNRPDCPEWAEWAAVDRDGKAYWYSKKPEPKIDRWYHRTQNPGKHQQIEESTRTEFDAYDWQNSLIERPAKELPELTATAFHCPDCPKEATKLKVFPANHVVALDKDDKVLSVMELQCQEGEISKPEWFYSISTFKLYQKDDYRCDIPKDAVPVRVHYPSPNQLIGKVVANNKTGKNYLVAEVNGFTVTLQGVDKKELISMPTLLQFYSFVDGGNLCCSFETLP